MSELREVPGGFLAGQPAERGHRLLDRPEGFLRPVQDPQELALAEEGPGETGQIAIGFVLGETTEEGDGFPDGDQRVPRLAHLAQRSAEVAEGAGEVGVNRAGSCLARILPRTTAIRSGPRACLGSPRVSRQPPRLIR